MRRAGAVAVADGRRAAAAADGRRAGARAAIVWLFAALLTFVHAASVVEWRYSAGVSRRHDGPGNCYFQSRLLRKRLQNKCRA